MYQPRSRIHADMGRSDADGVVYVWNPRSGEVLRKLSNADAVIGAAFSREGRSLAIPT
ncbi:hypothetical protein PO002_34070 [Cupriavidus necator]|uniref:hypothetical protein n=1 Tax=Cupriavidus necator TaxID=106590 RepID=UPI0039C2C330